MQAEQLNFLHEPKPAFKKLTTSEIRADLAGFNEFHKSTSVQQFPEAGIGIPVFVNEFWTSKQRAASPLHEVSYRACFKPQLPRFFINRLTRPGDVVYDPFMGRGTTLLEAALMGRRPVGCDISPLSRILLKPRLAPPDLTQVTQRLSQLDLISNGTDIREDLLAFYHPKTLRGITNLRDYLIAREANGEADNVDAWIRMVATNRLTGHSAGFFSVYTLPPNQALSIESQLKINQKRNQIPPERDLQAIILKKSRTLLKNTSRADLCKLRKASEEANLMTCSCEKTPQIADSSVNLVVTSPPFLDVVDYQKDNWLRFWFNGIDALAVPIWQLKKVEDWVNAMTRVFLELRRVLVPHGQIAFEVGEVRGGKLLMETLVVPAATKAGLIPELVLINDQEFTKTANCWGVSNLKKGTNTNRIILLSKEP